MKIKIGDKEICILHTWKEDRVKIGQVKWEEDSKSYTCKGVIEKCSCCGKQRAYIQKTEGKKYKIAPWALDVEVKSV